MTELVTSAEMKAIERDAIASGEVTGLGLMEIAGRGAEKSMKQLQRMPEVQAVHSTNGTWDLIAEIGTDTLEHFDQVLFAIRRMEGVTRSETNLLLSTRR